MFNTLWHKRSVWTVLFAAAIVASFGVWAVLPSAHANGTVTFTNLSLAGTYGFILDGRGVNDQPVAEHGVALFDGNGGVRGTLTTSTIGSEMSSRTFQGSYQVNPDGTGLIMLEYINPPVVVEEPPAEPPSEPTAIRANVAVKPDCGDRINKTAIYFVALNGGKELMTMQNDIGIVAVGSFKAQ
ncbi:MAG TPA: hypothetical protein VEU96_13975 [Bryobacteraceae bacterium]|nr:hypothetical protein [Bryobacteraceae bacterium]